MPKGANIDEAAKAKIKKLAKDLTQEQIAYRLGMSARTVRKVLAAK